MSPDQAARGKVRTWVTSQWKLCASRVNSHWKSTVLVTGDGNTSDFGTSFYQQVQRAIKRGWMVDVISWGGQLSKKFRLLAAGHQNQIKIIELENYYSSITFLVEGDFHHNDGTPVHFKQRIVSRLPKGK
jgi:hypothetical protein